MKEKFLNQKNLFITFAALLLVGAAITLAVLQAGKAGKNIQPEPIKTESYTPGESDVISQPPVESGTESGTPSESSTDSTPTVPDDPDRPETNKENVNKDVIEDSTDIDSKKIGITYPYSIKDGALKVNKFLKYDGYFTEDLSFSETNDALAIEIVNTSGKYIDAAVVTFLTDKQEEVSFWASHLAPGDVSILQEKNNTKYRDDLKLSFVDASIAYMDRKFDTGIADYISFKCTADEEGNNYAVIINNTQKTINDVKVWYKRNIDDVFIGGYTYILSFDELKPGETMFINAKFFNTDCIIVDAQYKVK
ncbi:MAG: hypothetical protein IJL87_07265 [Clostridia bacterium]|nr:hypothetical protein [Clostridia bacterium]